MILAVKAWRLRAAARLALGAGQFEHAFELAAQAQEAQRTASGEALRVVSELSKTCAGIAAFTLSLRKILDRSTDS